MTSLYLLHVTSSANKIIAVNVSYTFANLLLPRSFKGRIEMFRRGTHTLTFNGGVLEFRCYNKPSVSSFL